MTDAETVQFLVERLFGGKWPEHKMIPLPADDMCYRCEAHWSDFTYSNPDTEEPDGCEEWNPLTRIEDAFMVVKAMKMHIHGVFQFSLGCQSSGRWWCDFNSAEWSYADTSQAAIVAAAVRALEEK